MSDEAVAKAAADAKAAQDATDAATKAAADKAAADAKKGATTPPWGTAEEFDPEKAWNLIQSLRDDKKKSDDKAIAAAVEATRKELTEGLGKALGLIPEEATDPVKLQAKIAESEASAKQAALELAVFRTAESANANASALLDSRSFLTKVAAIDPTNSEALSAAIAEAVAENPLLVKGAPAAPAGTTMKPIPGQGGSAAPTLGLQAQIDAATAAGDTRALMRLNAQAVLQKSQ